jgi:hypothetical protein
VRGMLLAKPWAASVIGAPVMTGFAIWFAVSGNREAAAASVAAALYAALAARQTLMCVVLAGAMARGHDEEDNERFLS